MKETAVASSQETWATMDTNWYEENIPYEEGGNSRMHRRQQIKRRTTTAMGRGYRLSRSGQVGSGCHHKAGSQPWNAAANSSIDFRQVIHVVCRLWCSCPYSDCFQNWFTGRLSIITVCIWRISFFLNRFTSFWNGVSETEYFRVSVAWRQCTQCGWHKPSSERDVARFLYSSHAACHNRHFATTCYDVTHRPAPLRDVK